MTIAVDWEVKHQIKQTNKQGVLSYFLTMKFKGSDLCYFYLRSAINSFCQIYGNKLGYLNGMCDMST